MEMKEFRELANWLGDVGVQAWKSATNKPENTIMEWGDELLGGFTGIGGFSKAAKTEFTEGDADTVESIWEAQVVKMTNAGMPDYQARVFVSGLKTSSFAFMWAVKSKLEAKEAV